MEQKQEEEGEDDDADDSDDDDDIRIPRSYITKVKGAKASTGTRFEVSIHIAGQQQQGQQPLKYLGKFDTRGEAKAAYRTRVGAGGRRQHTSQLHQGDNDGRRAPTLRCEHLSPRRRSAQDDSPGHFRHPCRCRGRGLLASTSQLNRIHVWSLKPQQVSTSQLNLRRFYK